MIFPRVFYVGGDTMRSVLLSGTDQRVLVYNINTIV
jgi:hypothetical protein